MAELAQLGLNMRTAVSVVIFLLALGSAGALALWGMDRAPGETAFYRVEVIGPEGGILDETVQVEAATVLTALEAAAARAGLDLALVEYPGMGTYVRAIGPHEARGATGWIYEVHRDGVWQNGDRSAAFYALQKGDSVRWTWTGA